MWDDRVWKVVNVGNTLVSLLGGSGTLVELPQAAVESMVKEGRIVSASNRGEMGRSPAAATSKLTMEQFARDVERHLALEDRRPVVDATGLPGKFDFKLAWTPGETTFLDGLESQAGLRLERKQQQVEILVVDHAEKFPAEN